MMTLEHAQLAKKLGYPQELQEGDWIYNNDDGSLELIDYVEPGGEPGDELFILIPTMRGLWDWAESLRPKWRLSIDKLGDGIFMAKYCETIYPTVIFENATADTPECALLYLIKEILG